MLLVDAANVIGSRPTGWWRDRAGAARTFVEQLRAAVDSGRVTEAVIVILEGKAREGVKEETTQGVTVLHASDSGDDAIVEAMAKLVGETITLVTADRELAGRARDRGAVVVGPRWLLERFD